MLIYGICGKPCCGKSYFIKCLNMPNSYIFDCDKVAKTILDDNQEEVMTILGTIDKKEIANIIFTNEVKREEYLKFIWTKLEQQILLTSNNLKQAGCENFILDAPLLFEAKLDYLCDTTIKFETVDSLRIKRAEERGWSKKELSRRDKFFK